MPENRAAGYREGFGQRGYLVANPQDEYFGGNGDSDRYRDSIDGKSGCARCERHGFVGRQIGASAWRRSVDVNNSINRRHSGFAADYKDAPTRDEIAAALNLPIKARPRSVSHPAEALLSNSRLGRPRKMNTGTGRARTARARCPGTGCAGCPAQVRPVKKHRRVRSVQNARAEIRPQRNPRARVREEQNARAPVPPVPDPRAQEQAVQTPQTPWLLQTFGLR